MRTLGPHSTPENISFDPDSSRAGSDGAFSRNSWIQKEEFQKPKFSFKKRLNLHLRSTREGSIVFPDDLRRGAAKPAEALRRPEEPPRERLLTFTAMAYVSEHPRGSPSDATN